MGNVPTYRFVLLPRLPDRKFDRGTQDIASETWIEIGDMMQANPGSRSSFETSLAIGFERKSTLRQSALHASRVGSRWQK